MIELPPDPSTSCAWLICETGDRWAAATRRFAPQLIPQPWVASIVPVPLPSGGSVLPAHFLSAPSRCIVLWEIDQVEFSSACDSLASIATEYPGTLRLAAAAGLSDPRRMMISELGVAATVANPEDLPSLAGMLHAYFATQRHLLD
jgi:hypothetical protein